MKLESRYGLDTYLIKWNQKGTEWYPNSTHYDHSTTILTKNIYEALETFVEKKVLSVELINTLDVLIDRQDEP